MASTYRLNTGGYIPNIGFGTWDVIPDMAANAAVAEALKTGYRLIDTAQMYNNEQQGVGKAINESGIDRTKIFVTTKLATNSYGHKRALDAFKASLSRLGLDYVDLYLLHWPAPFGSQDALTNRKLRHESWRALEEIYKSGRAKNIGVSNFVVHHLEELLQYAKVLPAVNQIELHPFIFDEQRPIVESCQKYDIVVEAYSPLSRGGRLNDPAVERIAAVHSKSNAQILLRWAQQHDTVPLPRSTNPEHIIENFDLSGFELSAEEMHALNKLTENSSRVAPDPHKMK